MPEIRAASFTGTKSFSSTGSGSSVRMVLYAVTVIGYHIISVLSTTSIYLLTIQWICSMILTDNTKTSRETTDVRDAALTTTTLEML